MNPRARRLRRIRRKRTAKVLRECNPALARIARGWRLDRELTITLVHSRKIARIPPWDPAEITSHHVIFPPGDARRLQAFYQEELGMELAVTGLAESSAQLSAEEAARLLAGASGAFAGINRANPDRCQDDMANVRDSACAAVPTDSFVLAPARARDHLEETQGDG